MLLAGASALAMTVASAEAGATTFDFTASLVSWTVPTNGVYVITAYGAQGGSNLGAGGLGAEAGGYIPLSAGTLLAVTQAARARPRQAAAAASSSTSPTARISLRPAAAAAAAASV